MPYVRLFLKIARDLLLPGAAEADESFRNEVLRLGRRGLVVIAAIQILAPVFMLIGRWLLRSADLPGGPPIQLLSYIQIGVAMLLGFGTLWAARTKLAERKPRLIGAASGFLQSAVLTWSWILIAHRYEGSDRYIPVSVTVVLLVATVTLPFRPMQTLALGLSIEVFALLSWIAAVWWGITPGGALDGSHYLFTLMVVFLCTGLTGVLYTERCAQHEAHQRAIEAAEALAGAQTRLLLAESTASLGRLAAGLLHELNSPIGALASGLSTLLLLAQKQATAPAVRQPALRALQDELHGSLYESVQRLQQTIGRVRNLVTLEESDLEPVNLNELLTDALHQYDAQLRARKIDARLETEALPTVTCRPRQMLAVFSGLVSNALAAVEDGGTIRLTARRNGRGIEVELHDNGRGIPADQLAHIFNPGFTVTGARVGARNWGLFTARQIVLGHGGDISIQSTPGEGTTVRVTLPAPAV